MKEFFLFFKQKTAYEMRISDWSSDVCSSDLSLSILHRVGTTMEEREAYLRAAPWKDNENEPTLPGERMAELAASEQFILPVCANGYGKISSAYEYRRTGRGGQGITNIDNIARNGPAVARFQIGRASCRERV